MDDLVKNELRAAMRAKRRELPLTRQAELSVAACSHLLASECWQKAHRVALYTAARGEMDTVPLLENAWGSGKTVLLPLCSRTEQGKMWMVPCSGPENLATGAFDIPEPLLAPQDVEKVRLDKASPDIIVLPGVAFDRTGTRLGMGGGYYDRLLALPEYANCLRIGLGYAFQLVESLPRQKWDLPVHAVCTEKELQWIRTE